jgi:hypothetical protein
LTQYEVLKGAVEEQKKAIKDIDLDKFDDIKD